jgi:hypothetical protein
MFFQLLAIATATGFAAASISENCTAAFLSISSNSAASACLSPTSLAGVVAGGNSAINSVDQWLDTICPAAPCSNSTLENVVNTIAGGCQSELAAANVTASTSELVTLVQEAYPTVRQVACLKDGNTNCVTETLTNLQSSTNQSISLTSIISAVSEFNNLPTSVACTSCIQASYNIVAEQQPSQASKVQQALQDKCGTSFTNGSTPSGVTESASTATAGTKSNSATQPTFGGILVAITAFSSAFLLL